ncbi:MAG: rhodanese-like domain-containing protein [Deltaproteobacteria bacterium]|nr:rhodanese-like domain-containing protein [Deltaproteobacteria bacterium]
MAKEITAKDLHERLSRGEPTLLLDVRKDWEFELGALPGAVHLVLDELHDRAQEIVEPTDPRLIVTVCHHGVRSLHAAMILQSLGYANVLSLAGGTDVWSRMIDPSLARY